jgi:hypothetical protein
MKTSILVASTCCVGFLLSLSKSFAFVSHKQSNVNVHLKISTSYRETFIHATTSVPQSASSASPPGKRKRRAPTIPYITCTSTKELTRAIETYLLPGDSVAELGSQLRDSTTAICDTIGPEGNAVLIDIKRKFPSRDKKKIKDGNASTTAMRQEGGEIDFFKDRATFIELDGTFERWRHELFFKRASVIGGVAHEHENDEEIQFSMPSYTALVVDVQAIAGNDLDLTCIALVKDFLALNLKQDSDDIDGNINPCRVVIIKSGSLAQLSRRMILGPRLVEGIVSLPSYEETSRSNGGKDTFIVGTVGVEEYRRTIPHVIRKGDAVLEVGSHFGTSTALFHQAAKEINSDGTLIGGCIGVDIGPSIIQSARKKFPEVPFVVGDAWDMAGLGELRTRFLGQTTSEGNTLETDNCSGYDVVYVDVGGLSGSEGLLEAISLLSSIRYSLKPRCIIIKSLCVRRLASSLTPFSAVWQKMRYKNKE